jgi:hypothetical protein
MIRPSQAEPTKGKSVIIGDPRPTPRINNAKAEDHKVAKDESSSFQKTKKLKLTFEMLTAKYKKGLADERFDDQTSDSKRPRSSRRKRFGQTRKPMVRPNPPQLRLIQGSPGRLRWLPNDDWIVLPTIPTVTTVIGRL